MANVVNSEASPRITPAGPLPQERLLRGLASAGDERSLSGTADAGSWIRPDMETGSRQLPNRRHSSLADLLGTIENLMVYRRFAILHASVLLEESPSWWEVAVAVSMIDRVLVQRNTDDEGSIGMHQIASGEPQDRSVLLRFLQQEFAEYSDFISQAHSFLPEANWSADSRSVGQWLHQGPNIRKLAQESHPLWQPYIEKVRRVVLDPDHNDWLHYKMEDIMNVEGHGARRRRLRETAEQRVASAPPPSWSRRARHALRWLADALFLPAAILLYSVNISSAFGYLMLVNTPNPQENSSSDIYWKASLVAWVVTITLLLIHGLFFGKYTTECYTRRLVLTSIVFCGTIAFALHALANNAISGVLVGFTLSVAFLQIW